jgi:hypothetical protein
VRGEGGGRGRGERGESSLEKKNNQKIKKI